MGRLNGHIAIAWADDRQAFTAQTGGHRSIAGTNAKRTADSQDDAAIAGRRDPSPLA